MKGKTTAQLKGYDSISKEAFEQIKTSEIILPRKLPTTKIWKVKEEYRHWALQVIKGETVSLTPEIGTIQKWRYFITFVNDLAVETLKN